MNEKNIFVDEFLHAAVEAQEAQEDIYPFSFINKQTTEIIWDALSEELPHSQILTVIIYYLKSPIKEEILYKLPHEIELDVAQRLISFKRINPDILRETERVLERKIAIKYKEINRFELEKEIYNKAVEEM